MSRQCPAPGCKRLIGLRLLLCGAHWRLVRRELQIAVYATFRARDKERSPENVRAHREACQVAIASITTPEATS